MAERTNSPSAGGGAAANASSSSQTGTDKSGRQQSGGIVERVRDSAVNQLSTQKDRAIDGVGSVTAAVRQSTKQLRDQQHDVIARYVEQAADQIDNFTRQLREKDVRELASDAQRFARRQPAVFIGSAFALGLLGARFLKSSSRNDEYRTDEYGVDYGRGGQSGYRRTTAGVYGGGTSTGLAHDTSAGTPAGGSTSAPGRSRSTTSTSGSATPTSVADSGSGASTSSSSATGSSTSTSRSRRSTSESERS